MQVVRYMPNVTVVDEMRVDDALQRGAQGCAGHPLRAGDPTALPSRPPRRGAWRPRDAEAERACRSRGRRGANPSPSRNPNLVAVDPNANRGWAFQRRVASVQRGDGLSESSPPRSDKITAAARTRRAALPPPSAHFNSNDRRTPPFKHDAGGHALALRDNPATHGRVLGCARAIAGVREQQSWAARPDPVQALNTPLQSSDLWRGRMTKIAAFVTDTLYRACTGLCKAWHLDQKASAVRGN